MSTEKESAVTQSASNADSESGERRASAPGEVGYVPEDNRETDFFTRNGLNLRSFGRRDWGTGTEQLDRSMKSRHLNMIAMGGSIGTGFFVGSGTALTAGGPGSVFICFCIAGILVFNVVHALGELAVMYPVSGGTYTYSVRFISPAWGTAMGWNYVFGWLVVMPLELTVCTFTVEYWNKDIHPAIWITIFYLLIIVINIFGTLGYAEEEFITSLFKLVSTVIFMVVAVVLICGGGPSNGIYSEYWGARLWYDPGAFQNGLRGFCAVFVTAAFSFGGTELVGLAAAESQNPGKAIPVAVKQVFWRVTVFYVLGLTLVNLLVSSTDSRLLNVRNPYSEGTSPFVIVGRDSGLRGFDSFMNVLILVSVVSISVSCVYAGSRTTTSLAHNGFAPKIFTYIDRSGRPLFSVLLCLSLGSLAYLGMVSSGMEVFAWLMSLCSLCLLFTWGSICGAHIRFRAAWAAQGRSLDAIPYRAPFGVWGSWISLLLVIIFLAAQIFVAIAPPGTTALNNAEGFFRNAGTFPVVLFFWAVAYCMKRQGLTKLKEIDLDLGARTHDWDMINAQRAKVASWPWWRRAFNVML